MATTTSMEITLTKDSDNTEKTRTVSYINPNATGTELVELAETYVGLTNDNYVKTTRIDKTDCDTETTTDRLITSIKSRDGRSGGYYHDVDATGIINLTTAQIIDKQLMLVIKTPNDGASPVIEDFSDTDTEHPIGLITSTWSSTLIASSDQQNGWTITFADTGSSSQRTDITARIVSFKIHFDRTETYYSYEKQITFNITAAE